MIWSNGKILPDDGLSISINDRAFEHGLGLFETLRTWGGRPTLLDRHIERMLKSAQELKLSIIPASLPRESSVRSLLEAEGVEGDRILRITASGGTPTTPSVIWMKSAPLPEPIGEGGASLLLNAWQVSRDDRLARHKTLNYWARRRAFEEAKHQGFDEGLSGTSGLLDGDYYQEGSRTNLFLLLQRTGVGSSQDQRPILATTSTAGPIVPGIMRQSVLEIARFLPIEVAEQEFGIEQSWISLGHLKEVFLTNSVRGIIPVSRAVEVQSGSKLDYRWQSPGTWTRRLQEALADRLWPQM